ncbi:MAG: hypothetical protein ACFFAN_14145 [Promethearchaeota archaeon]
MLKVLDPKIIELKERVITYLKSKSVIRAVLLHKLEKRFCKSNSEFKVQKEVLISCLLFMMNERKIDIIIPELFKISWNKRFLENLMFLEEGIYFIRNFSNINEDFSKSLNKNNYYFDSRKLDFKKEDEIKEVIKNLKLIIKKIPQIKNKMIIYYPNGSKPLNIYDPLKTTSYNLKFMDFKEKSQFSLNSKIAISLEQQKSYLAIIKSYRKNYMCFYITLIESIQKSILDIQKQKDKIKNYKKILRDFIKKFAYYCIMYVRSDWVEIDKPNPYRWETFFKHFKIPFKIITLDFKSIKFLGRTFESWCNFKYCIFIKKNFQEVIKNLKKFGYTVFTDENYGDKIAVGLDLETYIPCPTIEHFYFLFKYIYYYHLFLLFNHSFTYIKKVRPNIKLTEKERMLFKLFLPVMESLFNIQINKISNKLVFNYYTFNPDELEIIYNKYLLSNIKVIEKKLYNYYLIKYNS